VALFAVALFAVVFFAVALFAVVFSAGKVTPRSAVARLVSLITSFKDASGKRLLKEARSGLSRVAVTAGRKRSR
jgi:hypothetical protein